MSLVRAKQLAYRAGGAGLIRWTRRVAARAGVGAADALSFESAGGADALEAQDRPDTTGVLAAFKVTGGIGDHLLAARYVRDLVAAAGDFRFDVYSPRPAVARWAFGGLDGLNNCYDDYFSWDHSAHFRHYVFSAWVQQFVVVYIEHVKWLTLNLQRAKLISICETIDRSRNFQDLNPLIGAHPRFDCLLGTKAVFSNLTRCDVAQAMSGIAYGGPRLDLEADPSVLEKHGLRAGAYVTVHNGFDSEFRVGGRLIKKSTKVYPYFPEVVALLGDRGLDIPIVQLGSTTSEKLKGADVQLINKTTLPQAAAVIAGARLHLDNESGLVHLAACVGTPSCVLFGPTPAAYFGYPSNINIQPRVCGGCWWATADWMSDCPRGFDRPICLSETPPESVAGAILDCLGGAGMGASADLPGRAAALAGATQRPPMDARRAADN